MRVEPEFKEMVVKLLRDNGRLRDENIAKYTTPRHMEMFRAAFIHKSTPSSYNYELMEFLGDARIDSITAQYIHKRFPEVRREGILTPMKHRLKSGKQLGQFGHDAGFFRWVRFAPGTTKGKAFQTLVSCKVYFKSDSPTEDDVRAFIDKKISEREGDADDFFEEFGEYTALLEDVFEAFIGTLIEVIDGVEPMGVSHVVAYNIITSFLDTVEIELSREWIVDPYTRLKEMYYDVNKWSIKELTDVTYDADKCTHTATMFRYDGKFKRVLTTATARGQSLATRYAAAKAIEVVSRMKDAKGQPLYPDRPFRL